MSENDLRVPPGYRVTTDADGFAEDGIVPDETATKDTDTYAKEYAATVWWHIRTYLKSAHFNETATDITLGAAVLVVASLLASVVYFTFTHLPLALSVPATFGFAWIVGKLTKTKEPL